MPINKYIAIIIAALSLNAHGQTTGVPFADSVTTVAKNVPAGAQAPIYSVPNAMVTVCSAVAGQTCSTYAAIFNDAGLTSAKANPIQADSQGRYVFYAAPGNYTLLISTAGGTFVGSYPIAMGGSGGNSVSKVNYGQTFLNSTTVILLNSNHLLATTNIIPKCYDTSGNSLGDPHFYVNQTTFDVTATFVQPQSGYCVLNGSGGAGGGGSGSSNTLTANFLTTNGSSQILYAWGNSQTAGYNLSDCTNLTCDSAYAWPSVFAQTMGWTVNNQAVSSSDCADLTYQGHSLSMWDVPVTTSSRNAYGHFRNDQGQYGPLPYRVDFARGCIEAEVAWLAIPDTGKQKASANTTNTGGWQQSGQYNSAMASTSAAGATMTFTVTGKTVYLAAAKQYNSGATFSVTVDGNPIGNPVLDPAVSLSPTVFNQALDVGNSSGFPVNENTIPYLIRVPPLVNQTHTVIYTCINPAGGQCIVFYAAAVGPDNSTANGPFVYTLSPIYNSPAQQGGPFTYNTTSTYYDEWKRILSELAGDGLQVVGVDATNPAVYNSTTQSQSDGVHETQAGHASIAAAFVSKATSAATPYDRAESHLSNAGDAYDSFGAGQAPATSGAGFTNPNYALPKGFLWTSIGQQQGSVFFGFDGTASLDRSVDSATDLGVGSGHIFTLFGRDGQNANFSANGRVSSYLNNVSNGGSLAVINGASNALFGGQIIQLGATPTVTTWGANAMLVRAATLGTANSPLTLATKGTAPVNIEPNDTNVGYFDLNGLHMTQPVAINGVDLPVVGTPTVGQAACIKAAGPPVIIGYCSTVVSSSGACTCN